MSYHSISVASYWRPHEKAAADFYFGPEVGFEDADLLMWRINTESLTKDLFHRCQAVEERYKSINGPGAKILNPISSYLYTNNKDACFSRWSAQNIRCPRHFTFDNRDDFESKRFGYPFLIRLNDGVTGEDTFLITNEDELNENFTILENTYRSKRRIDTKMICVEFIDTSIEENYKVSYRLIVAGNDVVVGYARISNDWLAITKQFTESKKPSFVEQNQKVNTLIEKHRDEIVQSVRCLGLHHQGIDAIVDKNDKLYFLEVQPFYFAGNTNRTTPPFWNPYKPPELVEWLIEDKSALQQQIPHYYKNWLDKKNHFDICYSNLKELFG